MSPHDQPPDVDRLARSMLMLHGDDHSHDEPAPAGNGGSGGSWSKAPDFADDPERAAAVQAATPADRTRYLTSGLQPVDCRFCHATVNVKRMGRDTLRCNGIPKHRSAAPISPSCARPANPARGRGPARNWRDSIEHAVAEGCLEAVSTATPPGDG